MNTAIMVYFTSLIKTSNIENVIVLTSILRNTSDMVIHDVYEHVLLIFNDDVLHQISLCCIVLAN